MTELFWSKEDHVLQCITEGRKLRKKDCIVMSKAIDVKSDVFRYVPEPTRER